MVSRKRFTRRVLPGMSVKIVAGTMGFVISSVSGPAAPLTGIAAITATEKLLHWTIGHYSDTYREFRGTIFDRTLGGGKKLEYNSVSQFWTWVERDVAEILGGRRVKTTHIPKFWEFIGFSEKDKRKFGMPIMISGLFSPHGPLMPAHPMSRPGYSVSGWENLGDLSTEDTEEYDVRDSIIYGDRVIRLSNDKYGKYYGGLYDAEFGIANVGLPLFIDEQCLRKGNLQQMWKTEMPSGIWARIRGNLIALTNFYSTLEQTPDRYRNLPSFGIEVTKIERWQLPKGHTHISASVAWERSSREKMLTNYFNLQDVTEYKEAESLLQETRETNKKTLQFDYDDEKYISGKWKRELPIYNQMLDYFISK